jgi:hypothetical protein
MAHLDKLQKAFEELTLRVEAAAHLELSLRQVDAEAPSKPPLRLGQKPPQRLT